MKRLVQSMLIMACLFSVLRPPLADEHESVEALASRLIELAHMDETMEQMLQAMLAELRNLADRAVEEGRSSATPEQLAEFEDIMREEMTAMRMAFREYLTN